MWNVIQCLSMFETCEMRPTPVRRSRFIARQMRSSSPTGLMGFSAVIHCVPVALRYQGLSYTWIIVMVSRCCPFLGGADSSGSCGTFGGAIRL